jgi:hypothetical protein
MLRRTRHPTAPKQKQTKANENARQAIQALERGRQERQRFARLAAGGTEDDGAGGAPMSERERAALVSQQRKVPQMECIETQGNLSHCFGSYHETIVGWAVGLSGGCVGRARTAGGERSAACAGEAGAAGRAGRQGTGRDDGTKPRNCLRFPYVSTVWRSCYLPPHLDYRHGTRYSVRAWVGVTPGSDISPQACVSP